MSKEEHIYIYINYDVRQKNFDIFDTLHFVTHVVIKACVVSSQNPLPLP